MKTVLLGDVATIQTGPFGSQLHQKDYVKDGTPIITVEHLGQDRISRQNLPRISNADKERLNRYWLEEGDTVFSRVGSVDRASYVHKEEHGWLFSGRCLRVSPDKEKVNPRFLSFLLRSPKFTEYIKSIAVGATMPSINTKLLTTAPIMLPSKDQQDFTAVVLDEIERKIELNRRMNETLEKIGQALFKHYFIDNPEAKTWPKVKIGELVNIKGGGTPSTKNPEFWNGDVAWTSPRDLTGKDEVFLLDTDKKITEQGLAKISSGLLPKGTLLLSSRAPIGYTAIADLPLAINQGYIAFLPDGKLPNYYTYFWLQQNMKKVKGAANGSTFMEISKSSFRNIEVQEPDDSNLRDFEHSVRSLFERIRTNQHETQSLTKLRDSLLPRLISGKIKV